MGFEGATFIDGLIAVLYLVTMAIVGLYFARKQTQDTAGYFLGGRRWKAPLIAMTIIATNLGAGYTVGATAKAVSEGVSAMWFLTAQAIIFIALAYVMIPRIYPLKTATIAEFLEQRYDRNLRRIAGIALCLATFAIMPAQVVAGAKVIQMLTGLTYNAAFWIVGFILIAYTSLGGLPAVVYTDVLQTIFIGLGFVIAVPLVLMKAGGFGTVYQALPSNMQDWFYGASGTWNPQVIIAWLFTTLVARFGSQAWFQRSQAAASVREAQKGFIWGGILGIPFGWLTMAVGVSAFVLFPGIKPNDALPTVFTHVLPVGLRSIALGAIIAAIMSSGDSFLNAAAALFINDVYKPLVGFEKSEKHYVKVAQFTSLSFGLLAMLLAFLSPEVLEWIKLGFLIRTSTAFVAAFGLYWKRVNAKGAYVGLILGTLTTLIWDKVLDTSLDAFWPTALVVVLSVVVVSLITEPPHPDKIKFFELYEKKSASNKGTVSA